ncbi:MAG: hypothetical protein ACHP8B_00225 [Terriglobales bacterium]
MGSIVSKVLRRIDRLAGVSIEEAFLYSIRAGAARSSLPLPEGASVERSVSPPFEEMKKIGWITAQDVEQRIRRGDVCYLVYLDGALVHYSWVQFKGAMNILGKAVTAGLEEGEFCVYDCVTAGWARGKKIYPSTISRIVSIYLTQGFSSALIYTTKHNIASQNGIRRAGFRQCATLKALRFGGHYFAIPGHQVLQAISEP